jgi:hypothetical protein
MREVYGTILKREVLIKMDCINDIDVIMIVDDSYDLLLDLKYFYRMIMHFRELFSHINFKYKH